MFFIVVNSGSFQKGSWKTNKRGAGTKERLVKLMEILKNETNEEKMLSIDDIIERLQVKGHNEDGEYRIK